MFLFKKIVGPLLLPVPVVLLLLAAGVVLLWFSRRQRLAKVVTTVALVVLAATAFRPLPFFALGALERAYPAFDAAAYTGADVRWIVVLDGGAAADPSLPPNGQMLQETVGRLVEGLRVLQSFPEARLLLAGAPTPGARSSAWIMREAAVGLGVAPERIVLEETSRDTKDQARTVRRIVGEETLVLVTSASHMRRAMGLFHKQGLDPVAAPADHLVRHGPERRFSDAFPKMEHVEAATVWAYETLGYAWARLRGQI